MNINEQIQLWNQVIVRVLDVRMIRIERGDEITDYITPSSLFIFTANGNAELWADGEVWLSERFRLMHVGKGKRLNVRCAGMLDVYMILYNASLPGSAMREFHMMMQTDKALIPSQKRPLTLLQNHLNAPF